MADPPHDGAEPDVEPGGDLLHEANRAVREALADVLDGRVEGVAPLEPVDHEREHGLRGWAGPAHPSGEGEQVVARLDRQVEARKPLGDGDVVVRDRGGVGALEVAARPLGGLAERARQHVQRVGEHLRHVVADAELAAGDPRERRRGERRRDGDAVALDLPGDVRLLVAQEPRPAELHLHARPRDRARPGPPAEPVARLQDTPASRRSRAAVRPANPPPITTTSTSGIARD